MTLGIAVASFGMADGGNQMRRPYMFTAQNVVRFSPRHERVWGEKQICQVSNISTYINTIDIILKGIDRKMKLQFCASTPSLYHKLSHKFKNHLKLTT
jgi:hypothetical protein